MAKVTARFCSLAKLLSVPGAGGDSDLKEAANTTVDLQPQTVMTTFSRASRIACSSIDGIMWNLRQCRIFFS